MKIYKLPPLSRLADWVAYRLVPDRVYAAIQIATYDDLDAHMREVDHRHKDGSRELFDAVSAVRIEYLRRKLWYDVMKATTGEK
jgi:hypothetical protein